jgi:lactate dehydrogenase-like 2-hydroxyacid dehydrogenase
MEKHGIAFLSNDETTRTTLWEDTMKLAILDDYEDVALKLADWNSLGPEIEIDVYHDHLDAGNELVDRLCLYDILVIMRERTPFPRRLIEQLPSLKLLVTTGARNLAIDLPACREQGIVVCTTGSSKTAAAELAWALILSTLRRIPQQDRTTRAGCWGDGMLIPTLCLRGHADCFNVERKFPQRINIIRLRFKRSYGHSFSVRYC